MLSVSLYSQMLKSLATASLRVGSDLRRGARHSPVDIRGDAGHVVHSGHINNRPLRAQTRSTAHENTPFNALHL